MNLILENSNYYNVAIYVRLSKEDENLENFSESILNQKSMLENFIKENNLKLYKIYIDDGFSGTNFERPSFKEMVKDIENKKINMVITKDLSRLGRDYIQVGYYLEKYFPEKNVRYISLLDNIDTGIESSINDITPFKSIMNDMYAKDISKKIKSVKQEKIKKGEFIGSKAPYGYIRSKTKKNKIEIDKYAAKIVKKIFNMALLGISARSIAFKLSKENILPPALYNNTKISKLTLFTNCWKAETISSILNNEVYIGNMVQGKVKKINYKSKKTIKIPKDKWVVVENTHEPIIDKEIFKKVKDILNKRKNIKTKTLEYSLKGLIFCKDCKIAMGAVPKNGKYYLRCRTYAKFPKLKKCTSHSIRLDKLEEKVTKTILNFIKTYITKDELLNIGYIILEKYYNKKNLLEEIRNLENKLKNINNQIYNLYLDKNKNIIEEEDFTRIYKEIKKEKENIKNYINTIKYKNNKKENNIKLNIIVDNFINIRNNKKFIINEFIKKIEVDEEKNIYIFFKI